ncbi:MAG: S41 family peptidase [Rikenellaceae bacterium]|nr:S41 family peptidase [Rikenellaceae bacterium]MCL2692824.1 S41 family peptidase [Rikenellaceae bacterium]
MKKILFISAAALFAFAGCSKESNDPTAGLSETNKWVREQMAENYLWSAELPKSNEGGDGDTPLYFERLRYRQNRSVNYREDTYGDRFSEIRPLSEATRSGAEEQSYDFGYRLQPWRYGENGILAEICYVIPGSPADLAGLRRGDIFTRVNSTTLVMSNWRSLLFGEQSSMLINELLNRPDMKLINLHKGHFYDPPILLDTIYETPARTAYLLYTHFPESGLSDPYGKQLCEAFGRFKAAGVETLFLDLRYNSGGYYANANLLASLLAPASELGKTFMYFETNRSFGRPQAFTAQQLLSAAQIGLYNPDIKNLYILTSEYTASASELIIHTLRTVYARAERKLWVVGETTYGKNLGGRTFTSDDHDWEMSLIWSRVHNLERKSGYEKGLSPDAGPHSEFDKRPIPSGNYYILAPLGDYLNEHLLKVAVSEAFPGIFALPTVGVSRSPDGGAARPLTLPAAAMTSQRPTGLIVDLCLDEE